MAVGVGDLSFTESNEFRIGPERCRKAVLGQMRRRRFGAPVYVRKEIVRNSHVVRSFRENGAVK